MRQKLKLPDEAALVAQFLAGDEQAFVKIVRVCRKALVRYGIHVAMDVAEPAQVAEDAVQDVFWSIWKRRRQTWLRGALTDYLFTAVRYRVLRLIEDETTRRIANIADPRWLPHPTTPPSPHEQVASSELEQLVLQYIPSLSAQEQRVFVLSIIAHLPPREIAAVLGIQASTVRAHLANARRRLRQKLRSLDQPLPHSCDGSHDVRHDAHLESIVSVDMRQHDAMQPVSHVDVRLDNVAARSGHKHRSKKRTR